MKTIRTLLSAVMLLCCFSCPSFAAEALPAPQWDPVLDMVYVHTWRGRSELDAELKREEARIGQTLSAYVAAWERRMALPIIYPDKGRVGNGCEPLNYCQADLLHAGTLALKLQKRADPLTAFIFSRLSPAAQQALGEYAPPAKSPEKTPPTQQPKAGQPAAALPASSAQLLTAELSKIIREENLSEGGHFTGVSLSHTTMTLVKQHNNSQNRVCINKSLLADAFPEELAKNFKCVILKDEAYRRVVAAKTVQYLRTGDRKVLDEGIALSEKFEDKLLYTDFAFWYHYPRTLADVHAKDSAALTYDSYALLNDVVLAAEPGEPGKATAEELQRRHYGWNLADVVLVRGIMSSKMEGLEALGSAMWLLGDHIEKKGGSSREQELAGLVVEVRKYLLGPESDNFRLNYAVAMREGQRHHTLLAQALDGTAKGGSAEQHLEAARENLRLAYEWAGTGQGTATALTRYLELVNLALARMKEILSPTAYAALAAAPGKANAETADALYGELAKRERGGWEKLRFIDRKGYVDRAHRLWNALRMNSLLVGEYYLKKMDPDDFQSVMENSEPAERALLRYLTLFEAVTANGHREIVPDSAYFAYAETAKMLSRLKRTVSSYNNRIEHHNQAINYLLKAIDAYPYDDSLYEYAAASRNINTRFNYISTDRAISRILSNNVIAKCLEPTSSYCDKGIKQGLEWNIYKTKEKLYDVSFTDRSEQLKALIRSWKEEALVAGTAGTGNDDSGKKGVKNRIDRKGGTPVRDVPSQQPTLAGQRESILKLADSYLAVADKTAALTGETRQQLSRCAANRVECVEAADAARLPAQKEDLQASRDELLRMAGSYRQNLVAAGTAESSRQLEHVDKLATMVSEVYLNWTDRLIGINTQRMLDILRHRDGHPMHKVIKSAYYMYNQ